MGKAIAILGTARPGGNTEQFLRMICEPAGIDIIDLADYSISPYDYQHRNRDDDFLPVMQRVLEHDAVIFASPVYWYSFSAQMKMFIDRTSDFLDIPELRDMGKQLRGKRAYMVCTSISEEADSAFLTSFERTVTYLGMSYGGFVHANCEAGFEASVHIHAASQFKKALSK